MKYANKNVVDIVWQQFLFYVFPALTIFNHWKNLQNRFLHLSPVIFRLQYPPRF